MENKKFRFNFVDAVVILALVAVVAFVVLQLSNGILDASGSSATYRMTFYTEESTIYSLENVKEGDPVCDESNDVDLGMVVSKEFTDKSHAQLETADGTYVEASRPGYGSGSVVFEGKGTAYQYGAKFDNSKYSVGQTVTLRVGSSKLYGRIKAIEVIK
jgi:hypothetical protein